MDFAIEVYLHEEERNVRSTWWKWRPQLRGYLDVFRAFLPLRVFRNLDAFLADDCSFQHLITPYFHRTGEITMLITRKQLWQLRKTLPL